MDARRRHEIYTESVENFVENVPRSQIFRSLSESHSGLHQHGALTREGKNGT